MRLLRWVGPVTATTHTATGSTTIAVTSSGTGKERHLATGSTTIAVTTSGTGKPTRKASGSTTIAVTSSGTGNNPNAAAGGSFRVIRRRRKQDPPSPERIRRTHRVHVIVEVSTSFRLAAGTPRAVPTVDVYGTSRTAAHTRTSVRLGMRLGCTRNKRATDTSRAWVAERNREFEDALKAAVLARSL